MGHVAGMDDESGLDRQVLDFVDRLFERANGVWIGRLVEADMTVADLQESKPTRLRSFWPRVYPHGTRRPAANWPKDASPRPDHAFQDLAPAQAAIVI